MDKKESLEVFTDRWTLLKGLCPSKSSEKPKLKILSVDGGGILGLVPAVLIAALEEKTGKKANEIFDVMVGTSTGGLIAGSLSVGVSGNELVDLYRYQADIIF